MNVGVDRYKRPAKLSPHKERRASASASEYLQSQVNDLWRTLPPRGRARPRPPSRAFRRAPGEPAVLHREERAAARALAARDRAHRAQDRQYFFPQRQTQVMNEGWATFWHYTLLNTCTTRACSPTAS
jgi:spore cortex formation protein SpoVR/YcgB (stage V sporulation)